MPLKRYNITYTPSIETDILKIKNYYLEYVEDGAYHGSKAIRGIIGRINRLRFSPEVGDIVGYQEGCPIHRIHWKRYNIYFRVDRMTHCVFILYIIDAHQKYRPFREDMLK